MKPLPAALPETAPDPLRRLSDDLRGLAEGFGDHRVTVGEVMDKLGARATALLMVFCALPFCSPVTLPGMSVPFGFVIVILALCYMADRPPWLPRRLRAVALPPRVFSRILAAGGRIVGWIEKQLRPRWEWLTDAPWKLRLHMLMVATAALLLLLPLGPFPPLTNTLPALVVIITMMSIMERDGLGIAAGHVLLALTLAYFTFWAAVILDALERVLARFAG